MNYDRIGAHKARLLETPKQDHQIEIRLTDLASWGRLDVIRILHVDDDQCILNISELMLKDLGNFEIDNLSCVDEALKKLETCTYDVIISDYEMPIKDGLEFLKLLKEQKNKTPFILFTGKGREEVAIKALNLGADGYYTKQRNPETVYGELSHGIISVFSRKQAEEKAAEANNRFAKLFETTPNGVVVYEAVNGGNDFVFRDFNPTAEKIEKISKNQVIGKKVTEVFPGIKELGLFKVLQRVLQTGKSEYLAESLYKDQRDAGSWRENWVYKLPSNEIVAIYKDITERKIAEADLRNSERKYRELINGLSESVWVIDFKGNVVDVNNAAVKMLGYSKDELFSIGIKGIDKNLTKEQVQNLISRLPDVGTQLFETVHTTKEGKEIPVEISSSLVNYQGNKAILSIARNIAARKNTEKETSKLLKAVQQEKDRLTALIHNINEDKNRKKGGI
jgi:PAS domain S-box-containing protein